MSKLGYSCFALAAAVLVFWLASGARIVTVYQVPQTRVVEDAFGDKVERTKMVDNFEFGLLPDKGYDGALPWIVGLSMFGFGLIISSKWRKNGDQPDRPEAVDE